jgi:hypothetical protein
VDHKETIPYTVLEIGSGSFKLHRNGSFSTRYQSSLGKNLQNNHLDDHSVAIALDNLDNQIIPFLKEHDIKPSQVKVFATAAVRVAMQDPLLSGKKFINQVQKRGFQDIRVFSEDQECSYAAWAVIDEIGSLKKNFLVLDTGGASHQLVEVSEKTIIKKESFPIGSHSDISRTNLPNFLDLGFTSNLPLTLLGTSGLILSKIPKINKATIREVFMALEDLDIPGRRNFLCSIIDDKHLYHLFVDYRLQVLPNAFRLIYNCVNNLNVSEFVVSTQQAMHFVSNNGFI